MLSVVIPTRNRAQLLARALASLECQTLSREAFEVIVVDNGSTDGTPEVVAESMSRLANVRYVREHTPGLHAGRHAGMRAARSDLLTFADDDIEALPTWLASIAEAFERPEVAMVGGNNLPSFIGQPPTWLLELWHRPTSDGWRALPALSILELPSGVHPIDPHWVWGCNFSVRRDVLIAAGGFHPDGMPPELIRFRGDGETHVSRYVAAAGLTCLFHSGATVNHKVTPERMTFAYFRQRGYSQGISDSYTSLRARTPSTAGGARNGILRRAAAWVRRKLSSQLPMTSANRALRELGEGHREGRIFHQRAYRTDAELRAWVHRASYFEELVEDT